ncbi:hypothetical protein [Ruminiclostridium cellobioparum]|uniref:hypothetical protein n=1 Tax=Ruminiclostridium cellobioparum TaxID=29355 RepID=UPI000489B290|nr:hypothetical protein [Ruminiclostridium cellobioparum]
MDFSKLFLGYNETDNFIQLAIREKIITEFTQEFATEQDFDDALFEARFSRINNKSSLLRLLLLFESVDSNSFVPFNLERLIDDGIVYDTSVIASSGVINTNTAYLNETVKMINFTGTRSEFLNSFITGLFFDWDKHCGTNLFGSTLDSEIAECTSYLEKGQNTKFEKLLLNSELTTIFVQEIIETSWFDSVLMQEKWSHIEEWEYIAMQFAKSKIMKYIIKPAVYSNIGNPKYSDDERINRCANLLDDLFTINGKLYCKKCNKKQDVSCLGSFFLDCDYSLGRYVTFQDIFVASEMRLSVYSRFLKLNKPPLQTNIKLIDDVYYLFSLPQLSQLNCLPAPQSLSEALRLRNRPEIVSFRAVFKNWCEQLQNFGDEKAIELITKDFTLASSFLQKQYANDAKSQKISHAIMQNFISIIFEIPGFFIPFFSLLFGIPEPWIKRNEAIKKKNAEWFLLTR